MITTNPSCRQEPTRVLHVTDCLAAGVESALTSYTHFSPPSVEHHLLVFEREDERYRTNGLSGARILSVDYASHAGLLESSAVLKNAASKRRADYVHLHSSFAGAYGRVARIAKSKIIYTPHCYSFSRKDIAAVVRLGFRAIEAALSIRTGVLAACGTYEARQARQLAPWQKVIELNNYVDGIASVTQIQSTVPATGSCYGTLGRICSQKGVDFFLSVVRACGELGTDCSFTWIGGGCDRMAQSLIDEGIEVTGWIPRSAALTALSEFDGYVHTASWEGNPISVIEAASLGLPVFARSLDALDAYGKKLTFASPAELARAIHAHSKGDTADRASSLSKVVAKANGREDLIRALTELYSPQDHRANRAQHR